MRKKPTNILLAFFSLLTLASCQAAVEPETFSSQTTPDSSSISDSSLDDHDLTSSHVHDYAQDPQEEYLASEANCLQQATYYYVCSTCGQISRQTYPYGELGSHDLREVKGYDPTCEKDGLSHGEVCSICGYSTQTVLPKTGHNMEKVEAKDATCLEAGYNEYMRCSHCGQTTGYAETPALGHDWVDVPRKEATCTEYGEEEHQKCSRCGEVTEHKYITKLGHQLVKHSSYAATCTEEGYSKTYYTCSREGCDYSSREERYVEDARGHLLEHHEAKEPDCLPGYAAYDSCKRSGCDYSTKVEIPATGVHHYVCDTCLTCGYENPNPLEFDEGYAYFGYYPQTQVTDDELKETLNTLAGQPIIRDWAGNNQYETTWSEMEKTNQWSAVNKYVISYKDVIYGDKKYRGVYMNNGYRIISIYSQENWQTQNKFYKNKVYWFEFERIKWRALTNGGGSALLMSDIVLDSQPFLANYQMIDSNYYNVNEGVPEGTYASNYQYSDVRAWLNGAFLDWNFNATQKNLIKEMSVDNSPASANPHDNSKYYNGGENPYTCDNTLDKVTIPSMNDLTNSDYGFYSSPKTNVERIFGQSEYTLFMGLLDSRKTKGSAAVMTRSPDCVTNGGFNKFILMHYATSGYIGCIESHFEDVSTAGILPMITVQTSA